MHDLQITRHQREPNHHTTAVLSQTDIILDPEHHSAIALLSGTCNVHSAASSAKFFSHLNHDPKNVFTKSFEMKTLPTGDEPQPTGSPVSFYTSVLQRPRLLKTEVYLGLFFSAKAPLRLSNFFGGWGEGGGRMRGWGLGKVIFRIRQKLGSFRFHQHQHSTEKIIIVELLCDNSFTL